MWRCRIKTVDLGNEGGFLALERWLKGENGVQLAVRISFRQYSNAHTSFAAFYVIIHGVMNRDWIGHILLM